MLLKPGDKAPTFTLLDQRGDKVNLSDFKGRKVLAYFYPVSPISAFCGLWRRATLTS